MSSKNLHISVERLVKYSYQIGDLNLESFDGSSFNETRVRTAIQNSRGGDYSTEVYLSVNYKYKDYNIRVYGKVDGFIDGLLLEEIKITELDYSQLSFTCNSQDLAQIKAFSYIYLASNSFNSVKARLTYFSRATKNHYEFEEVLHYDDLMPFFSELIEVFIKWYELETLRIEERNKSIEEMVFPFENCRIGQQQMMDTIENAIKQKSNFVIEAPTGIGKSISAIYPAIKNLTKEIDKIFYLTAKNSGFKSSIDAIFALSKKGLKIRTLVITSKEKVCINKGSACNAKECGFASGFFDRLNDAIWDIFQENDLFLETINHYALKHYICPFEFSLILTLFADVIICDYNYVFDPIVSLKRVFAENIVDNYLFLVDEAHNLVDRARSSFSSSIIMEKFDMLIQDIASENMDIVSALRDFVDEISEIIDTSKDKEFVVTTDIANLIDLGKDFLIVSERWLLKGRKRVYRNLLIEAYFDVKTFVNIYELYSEKYSIIAEKKQGESIITLFNVDPSENIAIALEKAKCTIFFSATVIPKEYYSYMFSTSANYLSLDSPYSKENHRVLGVSCVSTYYNDRENSIDKIAYFLNLYLSKNGGNTIVFFPSYAYMNDFLDYYQNYTLSDFKYVAQQTNMSHSERLEFLSMFSENTNIVGFAVMGGIFGEGIDLKGELLSGVFVVGVGLPGISIYNKVIEDYFQGINSCGFEYAYTYPGFVKVLQACGRLIRGENDRGVITIIDKRYGYKTYSELYPNHWNYQKVVSLKQYDYFLNKFYGDGDFFNA